METSRAILLLILLTGCATPETVSNSPQSTHDPSDGWIRGSMTRLEDGATFSFRIQKRWALGGSATGGVAAIGQAENFRGDYSALLAGGNANTWGHVNAEVIGTSGYATGRADYNGFTQWRSNIANAQGSMNDGAGTVIMLQMQIRAGLSPHGIGQGSDNKGRHYQLQF